MKLMNKRATGSTVAVSDVSFSVFKYAIAKQFELMKPHGLFRVRLTPPTPFNSGEAEAARTKDILWDTYLAAFPEGTNPIYRERTEHDCNCCKQFVRTLGGVVAIVEGNLVSIWDSIAVDTPELGFYREVMDAMAALVRSASIDNIFLHTEKMVGTEKTFMQSLDIETTDSTQQATTTTTWHHFHVHLPTTCIVKGDLIGPKTSEARATFDVLKRGLEELTLESVDTVLELIAQNSLYRGEDHKRALAEFRRLKAGYETMRYGMGQQDLLDVKRAVFTWSNIGSFASRIRNTAVGTLLIDLSADVDLDEAVRKFEAVMAPTNYKRPTALVTKAMIEKARQKIADLGFTSALERRYATIDDITINNVLYADRTTRLRADQKNVFDDLVAKVPEKDKKFDKVESVSIDKFLSDILPKATSLEVMFEHEHAGKLVSLIAPVDPGAKGMFKWPNNFSWSYAGEVADSIKERVKKAGGSVVGDLCCRLAWDYADDLDLHMKEPGGIYGGSGHIFYGNRRQLSPNGGMLDLDANGADGPRADPAENIFYASKARMAEGVYNLYINNYARRSTGVGFTVEIEFDGVVHSLHYDKAIPSTKNVEVAVITYSRKNGFKVESKLASSQSSKTVWGITTQTFHKVNAVMLSPNYWSGELEVETCAGRKRTVEVPNGLAREGVGNKHYFFMLEGCKNEDKARGFFNEFLSSELEPHRKVMEMVGAKMRTDESDRQLSGLGFSFTQRASMLVRVQGTFNRVVKVDF